MKFIEPYYQVEQALPYHDMVAVVEHAARTCYQSEGKVKDGSGEKLIRSCIKKGHESVLEHCVVSVRIVCDRGVSHELVRHRLCAFSQESQRYCAYKENVEFVRPWWASVNKKPGLTAALGFMLGVCEKTYTTMLKNGLKPQDARAVLPNATKTEIVCTANIREWRHIFKLRCSKAAHPEMRRIMRPMLAEFADRWPVFFDDIKVDK